MSNQNDVLSLVGRILLALMFLIGGTDKIMGMEGTLKYMTANGVPMPGILVYAAIVIALRLATSVQPEGWASLMIVVLIVSGVQMLMIGILGEYLWRNLDETRRRPRFIFESVLEANK